jgi:hypothetical protein
MIKFICKKLYSNECLKDCHILFFTAGLRLNSTNEGPLINPEGTDSGVIAIITIVICTTVVLVLTAVSF